MRKIHLLLFLLLGHACWAQFGNEWIDYSRQYWKFAISTDGVYRITYESLLAGGFPVGSVQPNDVRFYSRGAEVRVRAHGADDGTLDPGDYFEILGKKNDGWLDAQVYTSSAVQANPNYSLFNDTAHCFVAFTPGVAGLRTFAYTPTASIGDLTPAPYVIYTERQDYVDEYQLGKQDVNGISLPWYEEAEGWSDTRFSKGQSRSKTLATPNSYAGSDSPNAEVDAVSMGASLASGIVNHHLQVGYGNPFTLMVDTIFYGYQLNKLNFSIPSTALGSTTIITHRSVDDLGVATDFNAIAWIQLRYARTPSFSGTSITRFDLPGLSSGGEQRLDIAGVAGTNPRLYLGTSELMFEIPLVPNGSVHSAVVPVGMGQKVPLILVTENAIGTTPSVTPVTSTGYFTDYSATPLDSAFVMITHPSLFSEAQAYKFHREGSGMDVLLVNVEELYFQYAAGIRKHPLAIRRFMNELISTWPSRPSHLFLVGKSIHEMKISNTQGSRNDIELYASSLVPSWGYPTSDIPFTAGLGGSLFEVAVPTGRLAVTDPQQLQGYLVKVVQYESQPPALWKKRVLHFGGGGNSFEQGLFAGYLENYKAIVQDTCFGGQVHSFYKTTNEPIQLNLSTQIGELINGGVSLMTFFGHASSTGFDINIDSPEDYNNEGKYPLLIGNSCYTGNIHLQTSNSASEIFVLAPNAGTIGFIAKPDLGAPVYLNIWTENFYRQVFQQSYGASIGQCMQRAVQAFQSPTQTFFTTNTVLTFSLHGDPAIVLNSPPEPDYEVLSEGILFEPAQVTSELETFQVKVVVNNLGKAINGELGVELIRHFPNGTDTSLVIQHSAVYAQDTLVFELPVDRINGLGINTFDVFVDYPSLDIPELEDVTNNIVYNRELNITSGNLLPVYPFNFAIEPDNSVVLKASTGDPLAQNQSYRIEFDTVDSFDSPMLQSTEISSAGGVLEWAVPMTLQNDQVYYWRAASVPALGDDYEWRMHSFQYLDGERGWGQSEFDQFRTSRLTNLEYNEDSETMPFTTGTADLTCTVYGASENAFENNATRYQLDLEVLEYGGCGNTPALHVAVIDPITLEPWKTNYEGQYPQNEFGNILDCTIGRDRPENYFIFRQNSSSQLAGFTDLLSNQIPDGYHVLIYTWKYANYDGWEANHPEVFDVFTALGSNLIGAAADSVPFIFYTVKGAPETAQEVYGSDISALIELTVPITGSVGNGSVTSPVFGPSSTWDALYWEFEEEPSDSTSIRLFGVGQQQEELASVDGEGGELVPLSDYIDGQQYQRLQLRANVEDITQQTAPQLRRWQLLGDHAPECALDPKSGFYFPKDTIQQGEPLIIAVAIKNIGAYDMDSLLVGYEVRPQGQPSQAIPYERQDSLRVGEIFLDTVYIDTEHLSGYHILRLEANPRNPEGIQDQLEQYSFNNLLELGFFVEEDKTNPLLDVTFDGRHILNGELISPRPVIEALLEDENPYFIMNEPSDTAQFKVFITYPSGNQIPVYFSQLSELQFIPADGTENRSRIRYTPEFTENGIYRLLIQAQDKSGNNSGDQDYRIEFEVNTRPSITEVVNYPNPFSTRTQFVFTLTGVEPPDEFLIRIMTVSGIVVREIRQNELGPLRIGHNRSEFWWDGTDMFGDRLANGIYMYTVQARLRGEDLEINTTEASPYFYKGVGKMYLLR